MKALLKKRNSDYALALSDAAPADCAMNIVKKFLNFKTDNKNTPKTSPLISDITDIALGKKPRSMRSNSELGRAVSNLPYGDELIHIAARSSKFSKFALQNIANHLDTNNLELEQLKTDFPNIGDQLAVTSYCKNDAHSESLLAPISNEATLVSLCEEAQSARLRQQLISKINSENLLKMLEKSFKSKDKNSFKLIKSKLDSIRKSELEKQEALNNKANFFAQLEAHSKRTFNKDYAFNLASLERKYEAIFGDQKEESADAENAQKAKVLLLECKETLENALEKQTKSAQESIKSDPSIHESDKHESAQQANDAISTLAESLHRLLGPSILDHELQSEFSSELSEIKDFSHASKSSGEYVRLREASEALIYALNNDEDFKKALSLLTAKTVLEGDQLPLKNALKLVRHQLRPISRSKFSSFDFASTELSKILDYHDENLSKARKLNEQTYRNIGGMIRKAQAAVRDGHLKRAQGIRYSIEEKLEALSYTPEHISRQWLELQESINKLGDWQSYAILPKLEALVEAMEKLALEPLAPDAQATKIKNLQTDWKSLNKGAGNAHQDLWEIFKKHSDTAYQVCKKHYDELDTERAENTEKRQVLIKQLVDYHNALDWEQADWSQVEKLLSSAKKEWQNYSPSLRAKQKDQQKQFNEALQQIQSHLDAWYHNNKLEKERLINSLAPLTKSDDLAHSIELAIKFQKQWKTIGRCRRSDDDQLWQTFRQHCDVIFDKRDQERQSAKAEIADKVGKAETLLEKIRAILALDDEHFETQSREVEAIKQEFYEIEALPKNKYIALDKKLRELSAKCDDRTKTITHQRKNQLWKDAFELKAKSLALTDSDDSAAFEALEAEIKQLANQVQKPLLKSLLTAGSQGPEEAEQIYRGLCIQAEIALGLDTPEHDKTMRMSIQVKQLQAGLGQQGPNSVELSEQWLASPRVNFDQYEQLHARFIRSIALN